MRGLRGVGVVAFTAVALLTACAAGSGSNSSPTTAVPTTSAASVPVDPVPVDPVRQATVFAIELDQRLRAAGLTGPDFVVSGENLKGMQGLASGVCSIVVVGKSRDEAMATLLKVTAEHWNASTSQKVSEAIYDAATAPGSYCPPGTA